MAKDGLRHRLRNACARKEATSSVFARNFICLLCEYRTILMSFVLTLILCSVASLLGGYPWFVVSFFTLAILLWRSAGTNETLIVCGLALGWLCAFHFTGDRRLFFPYSMLFAALGIMRQGRALQTGTWAALLFFAIRILQGATPTVLLVEVLVAVVALTPAYIAQRVGSPSLWIFAAVGLLCSVLAFFGLAF